MRKIVVDYPLAPVELKPVPIEAYTGEKPALIFIARRCGIKRQPSVSRKIDFHPAVCIAFPDDVIAAEVVVLTRQEAGDVTRRDSDGTEHHSHRRGKVFAVAGAANKQKIGEWVGAMRAGKIERVGVVRN